MDPDLVKKKPYYGQCSDIWAIGVMFFMLLTGKAPFIAQFEDDLIRKICQAKYAYPADYRQIAKEKREPVTDAAKNLIRKIFEPHAKLRISAKKMLRDAWLKEGEISSTPKKLARPPSVQPHARQNLMPQIQKYESPYHNTIQRHSSDEEEKNERIQFMKRNQR